jgi:hypothetical protein
MKFNQSGSCGTPPPEPSCRCERTPSRRGRDQTDNNRRVSTIRTHMVRNAADAIYGKPAYLTRSPSAAAMWCVRVSTVAKYDHTPSPDSPLLRNASPGLLGSNRASVGRARRADGIAAF